MRAFLAVVLLVSVFASHDEYAFAKLFEGVGDQQTETGVHASLIHEHSSETHVDKVELLRRQACPSGEAYKDAFTISASVTLPTASDKAPAVLVCYQGRPHWHVAGGAAGKCLNPVAWNTLQDFAKKFGVEAVDLSCRRKVNVPVTRSWNVPFFVDAKAVGPLLLNSEKWSSDCQLYIPHAAQGAYHSSAVCYNGKPHWLRTSTKGAGCVPLTSARYLLNTISEEVAMSLQLRCDGPKPNPEPHLWPQIEPESERLIPFAEPFEGDMTNHFIARLANHGQAYPDIVCDVNHDFPSFLLEKNGNNIKFSSVPSPDFERMGLKDVCRKKLPLNELASTLQGCEDAMWDQLPSYNGHWNAHGELERLWGGNGHNTRIVTNVDLSIQGSAEVGFAVVQKVMDNPKKFLDSAKSKGMAMNWSGGLGKRFTLVAAYHVCQWQRCVSGQANPGQARDACAANYLPDANTIMTEVAAPDSL